MRTYDVTIEYYNQLGDRPHITIRDIEASSSFVAIREALRRVSRQTSVGRQAVKHAFRISVHDQDRFRRRA